MTRTCATCTESIGSSLGLMCVLKARLATEPCEHYERESGADMPEPESVERDE